MTPGQRIKQRRESLGLSSREVTLQMPIGTDLTLGCLHDLESDSRYRGVRIQTLIELAGVLGMESLDELLLGKEPKRKKEGVTHDSRAKTAQGA